MQRIGLILVHLLFVWSSGCTEQPAFKLIDIPTSSRLTGVWADPDGDVFAVGVEGPIVRRSGDDWDLMSSGVTENLTDVWGWSPTNVFAVGADGTIIRYDGNKWSPMESNTNVELTSVSGSSPSNIFAAGGEGIILRYDGETWAPMESNIPDALNGIWVQSETEAYAVGHVEEFDYFRGYILHFDGDTWSETYGEQEDMRLHDVWGIGSQNFYVVGIDFEGRTDIGVAANAWGIIIHIIGASSLDSRLKPICEFEGVWGSSEEDIFVVGAGYKGCIFHWNGRTWSRMSQESTKALKDVCGNSHGEVFAVGLEGYSGKMLQYKY
jgi:hypothetical protein